MEVYVGLFWVLWSVFWLCGASQLLSLRAKPAPYGRFAEHVLRRSKLNSYPTTFAKPSEPWLYRPVSARLGWFLMEFPSVIAFGLVMVWNSWLGVDRTRRTEYIALAIMFLVHYVHRSVVFPLRMWPSKSISPRVILAGALFTTINGFLCSSSLIHIDPELPDQWIRSTQFSTGAVLWLLGVFINVQSDDILRSLRSKESGPRYLETSSVSGTKDPSYSIPFGGLFRYVACPNYLGECIEWTGWMLASNLSTGPTSFAIWTWAFLGLRSLSTDEWYHSKFGHEYSCLRRKRMIPFLF